MTSSFLALALSLCENTESSGCLIHKERIKV
jgi:hypothetical protein